METISSRIKKHRKIMGLSLERLGQLTKSSPAYLCKIENDKIGNISAVKLNGIAKALFVSIEYLLGDKPYYTSMLDLKLLTKITELTEKEKTQMAKTINALMQVID